MSVLNLYPTVRPTLSFDFVNAGVLDPSVTFTRPTSATYFDETGILRVANPNTPRFDYNPSTLAAQGLLIEESRTNSIRNNTMVGAAAGTPGTLPTNWSTFTALTGLTREIVGTGTESGISYIDVRLSGTPSAAGVFLINFESNTQNAASNGQAWSGSTYCKLQAGSLTGISSLVLRTSALDISQVELSSTSQTFTPTSAALNTQRNVAIHTNISASTAYEIVYVRVSLSGAAIDITLRIGLPQLELGAFATSVIPTTTTALTRSADVASVNTLSPWYNATEGTLFAEFTASANASTVYAALSNGTIAQNSVYFDNDSGFIRNVVFSASSAQAAMSTGAIGTVGAVNKVAGGYKVNDFAVSRNGGSVVTDTLGAVPLSISQLDIGRNPNAVASTYVSGYLRRITYYPVRLTNAQLQNLTA